MAVEANRIRCTNPNWYTHSVAHLYTPHLGPPSLLTDKRKTGSPVTHSLLHLSLSTLRKTFLATIRPAFSPPTLHINHPTAIAHSHTPHLQILASGPLHDAPSTSTYGPAFCSQNHGEEKSLCAIPRLAALHRPSFGLWPPARSKSPDGAHHTCCVVDVVELVPRFAVGNLHISFQRKAAGLRPCVFAIEPSR